MAILKLHEGCLENTDMMEGLERCFDSMILVRVEKENIGKVYVYEVQSAEVPSDQTQIVCEMHCIEGIKPFVTKIW